MSVPYDWLSSCHVKWFSRCVLTIVLLPHPSITFNSCRWYVPSNCYDQTKIIRVLIINFNYSFPFSFTLDRQALTNGTGHVLSGFVGSAFFFSLVGNFCPLNIFQMHWSVSVAVWISICVYIYQKEMISSRTLLLTARNSRLTDLTTFYTLFVLLAFILPYYLTLNWQIEFLNFKKGVVDVNEVIC